MSDELLLQWLVIAPLLLWSAWRVAKQFAPRSMATVQNRFAQALVKRGYQRVGGWMQSGSTDAGCGSGCASCNSCAPSPAAASAAEQRLDASAPVRWRDSGRG
jgi:hypothetical protein